MRNKLYKYLRFCKIRSVAFIKKNNTIVIDLYFDNAKTIYSIVLSEEFQELEFCFWYYTTIKSFIRFIQNNNTINFSAVNIDYTFTESKNTDNIIFDSDCIISVIDCKFLSNKISYYIIKYIAQSIRVRDIENVIIFLFEYIFLKLFLSEKIDISKKTVIEKIRCYVYIVDNLKTNLLIESDILDSEQITINYKQEILYIGSCRDIRVFIKIIFIKNKIKKSSKNIWQNCYFSTFKYYNFCATL